GLDADRTMDILFDDGLFFLEHLSQLRIELEAYLTSRPPLGQLENLSLYAYPEAFRRQDASGAVAFLAFVGHQADRRFAFALSSHLDEAEPGDRKDADLGAVPLD